ncbi:TonB-dependent siderophore receptor [Variovorax sp. KBW07]|uniref:TonB-dependent receptor n=1 Tax=Variovorax sp. KBW07 TaxID=2153358 RepID=UPI000F56638B|nr:TonB-dependent receptor [Variovorax sp. KBW07]RQO63767.1 TonB-dependent siderophore receptor [Variovorax sp. KBW07]
MSRRTSSAPTLGLLALLGSPCVPAIAQQQQQQQQHHAGAPSLPQIEVADDAPSANGRLDLDTPSDTASRLGLTPRETPASVTVVNRSVIDARGAQNTQEILRAVPGVTAHDAPGNIGVSYRGFGSGSIGQMFNGINVQYAIAARPVDSWIYDRVEAIGGPSSFLFGSGALGGSINYITKTAERGDFAEAQLRLGTQNLKEASFGLNRRIAGDGGAGSHYARIDVNHRDANGWTDGTKNKSTQLAASLLSDLGGGLKHTLAYEYQEENVDRPYWGTPVLNPVAGTMRIDRGIRFKNYNSSDGLYAQRVQWLRSVTEWQATDALQFKNTFYAYDALRDYRNVESYRYNPANTAVIRSGALLQRHDQDVWGNRIEGIYKGQLGGLKSDWSFGLDYSVNRQTRFPNSLPATVSTVNPYVFATERFFAVRGMTPGFRPDRDNKVTTTALYLENRTALMPALNLVTALRHERIDLDLVNRRTVDAANPATFHRGYKPTTGRIGLVWDFAPGANLYAQYATAADPPSGVLSTASFADVRNNSELTTGRQAEVGTKLDFWQGKGTATLAAYSIRRKNIATQDPNNSALTVLVGEQSSKGVELALGLQPTPQWSLQGNLTYVDARYERFTQGGVSLAGRTPTNTPAVVANLWVSYAFTPRLQATVGVRHVGKVYADAANTINWPGYTLLDLGLSWKVNRSVTLVGRIRNATDRVYAANVGSTFAYLGAPRTADVSLRVAF